MHRNGRACLGKMSGDDRAEAGSAARDQHDFPG